MNMENALVTQTVENPSSSTHVATARGPAKKQNPQIRYAECPNKTTKPVVRSSQPTLAKGAATPASVDKGGLNVVA